MNNHRRITHRFINICGALRCNNRRDHYYCATTVIIIIIIMVIGRDGNVTHIHTHTRLASCNRILHYYSKHNIYNQYL